MATPKTTPKASPPVETPKESVLDVTPPTPSLREEIGQIVAEALAAHVTATPPVAPAPPVGPPPGGWRPGTPSAVDVVDRHGVRFPEGDSVGAIRNEAADAAYSKIHTQCSDIVFGEADNPYSGQVLPSPDGNAMTPVLMLPIQVNLASREYSKKGMGANILLASMGGQLLPLCGSGGNVAITLSVLSKPPKR